MEKIPTSTDSLLATHSRSWSCGNRGIGLLVIFFLVLENLSVPIWPLLLRKLPCLSVLMVRPHRPVTEFFGLTFLISMKSEASLSTQDLYSRCLLQQTVCGILVLPELMLPFARTRSHLGLCSLLLFHRWPYSVPSMSLVRRSTPLGTSIFVLPESLVTSSRHNDRCTHGTVVKLQTSCCSPFSVVTKQNDPAAAAYFCVSGLTVQCSSSVTHGDLDRVLSFRVPDFVHLTRRCDHCLDPQSWHWQLVLANWLLVLDEEVAQE